MEKQQAMDTRLKRLHYRSWHRGCKETDVILGQFADEKLSQLDGSLLDAYEKLLDEDDVHIWNWLTEKEPPASDVYQPILALLREYTPPSP